MPAFPRRGAYLTYDGHCAFCGKAIEEKGDWRICKLDSGVVHEGKPIFTFMPSCTDCSKFLSEGNLENFRQSIEARLSALQKDSLLQIACRSKGLKISETPFQFFFERLQASNTAFFKNLS